MAEKLYISKVTGNVFRQVNVEPGQYERIGYLHNGKFTPAKQTDAYVFGKDFAAQGLAFYPACRTSEGEIIPTSSVTVQFA
jgi:hypothetical protein